MKTSLALSRALWLVLALLAGSSCSDDPQSQSSGLTEPVASVDQPATAAATIPLSFAQISASSVFRHTCGVTTDNKAYCWGSGTLGDGQTQSEPRLTPVAVAGGHLFRQIDVGASYTCAATTDNRAFCWGGNHAGQLGSESTRDQATPVPVSTPFRFRHVATGSGTTCGLSTENRVYCWGDSFRGKLGSGTSVETFNNGPTEIAGGRRYNQVTSGWDHSCALTTTNEIFCWGSNQYGQLGDASTAKVRLQPVRVSGGRSYRQVSAGYKHTCAVTTTFRAICWGFNPSGQVGDGSTLNRWEPRQVAGTVLFERVTAGARHTCAESTDNRAYCWGANFSGELGTGNTTSSLKPVAVTGGLWFAQLTAGNQYSCGVTSDNRGYCWGANDQGTLGDGTTIARTRPTPVAGPN